MSELHLSRIVLRTDPSTRAILPLFMPRGNGATAGAVHRLVWSLFGDEDGQARDYLWREDVREGGSRIWYALGPRPPVDRHNLFDIQTRPWALDLKSGDRLGFVMRANATMVHQPDTGQGRVKKAGIVMTHMRRMRAEAGGTLRYADVREQAAQDAALDWMTRIGVRDGFHVDSAEGDTFGFDEEDDVTTLRVKSCIDLFVPRGRQEKPIKYEVIELEGVLVVDDPGRFVAAMARGFGRGRAFGLGMMMVRRA